MGLIGSFCIRKDEAYQEDSLCCAAEQAPRLSTTICSGSVIDRWGFMYKKLWALWLVAGISSTASAEAPPFQGLNAQLGLGFSGLHSDLYALWRDVENDRYGQSGVFGTASLGYAYRLEGAFQFSTNVFYDFGAKAAGSYADDGDPSDDESVYLKKICGISAEPGYALDRKTIIYAKLGVGFSRASSRIEFLSFNYGSQMGLLYGMGMKHLLTENIFVAVESYRINFSRGTETAFGHYGNYVSSNRASLTYTGINIGFI